MILQNILENMTDKETLVLVVRISFLFFFLFFCLGVCYVGLVFVQSIKDVIAYQSSEQVCRVLKAGGDTFIDIRTRGLYHVFSGGSILFGRMTIIQGDVHIRCEDAESLTLEDCSFAGNLKISGTLKTLNLDTIRVKGIIDLGGLHIPDECSPLLTPQGHVSVSCGENLFFYRLFCGIHGVSASLENPSLLR